MFNERPALPSLPAEWPFTPRPPLPRLACRDHQTLPGLGDGWRLCILGEAKVEGPEAAVPHAFGRGGIRRVGSLVLRPYRRGGLLRHVNERIYRSQVRFAAEFAIHRALWLAGFPTVEPVGYAWRRAAWGVEGLYLSKYESAEPWPRHWEASAQVMPRLGEAIRALCAWGLWAPDLNATNLLLAPESGILLLDWDRARFAPSEARPGRYRARLVRSLRKLGAPDAVVQAVESEL